MIEKNLIFWDDYEYLDEWISRMNIQGTFADHYAIQVVANLLFRDIITIPTKPKSAHYLRKYCLIKAAELRNQEPIFVLWFEEYEYGVGHYQSVQPNSKKNSILEHYSWLLKNVETSRIMSIAAESTVCENATSRVMSASEFSQPLMNSSENEDVFFKSKSKIVKKGCHVCKRMFMKNNVKKLCKKCNLYCHSFCINNCTE